MTKDQLEALLKDPLDGSKWTPTRFEVLFTAENVLVVRGAAPPDVVQMIDDLYMEKSGGKWLHEHQLATQLGAKLVMGTAESIVALNARFEATN